MDKPKVVKWSELCQFLPRQKEAQKAAEDYQYVLYGGSRGPGKSYFLRWWGVRELIKLAESGLKVPVGGLFCETYRALQDRQIGEIAREFPEWLGSLHESKEHGLAFHLARELGGGVLKLRNLDDVEKYKSAQFAFVLVDEVTQNDVRVFNVLKGSMRWPGVEAPRFIGATNPGGPGHIWVRDYWIYGQFPPEMQEHADKFHFVKALPTDNPHLPPSYWDMLNSLPPDLARAWRDGDWDVFEGQFFSNLSKETNGFEGEPPAGKVICSMDYGEAAPAAFYWATIDHDGDVWAYREFYSAGYQYIALKNELRKLSVDNNGRREQIGYTVVSPDIFQTSKGTGVVGSEVFNSGAAENGGFSWPVVKADNNRIEGWRHMKQWITNGRLHVSTDACRNFWRTAPAMIYDERNPEDMNDDGEDHACESIRYLLMSRPKPRAKAGAKVVQYSAEWIHKQFAED